MGGDRVRFVSHNNEDSLLIAILNRGIIMDNETLNHLLALREMNKALIIGLNAAIYILENEKVLIPEIRQSMIKSLKGLITLSEQIYGERATMH